MSGIPAVPAPVPSELLVPASWPPVPEVGDGEALLRGSLLGRGLADPVGLADADPVGLADGLGEPLGVALPLGLALGLVLGEGLPLGVALPLGLALGLVLGLALGDPLGDGLGDGSGVEHGAPERTSKYGCPVPTACRSTRMMTIGFVRLPVR